MLATGAPPNLPFAAPSRRRFVWLLTALVFWAGCGDSAAEKQKAYDEALAAVDREKAVLRNMRDERERLLGEYQMHDFEIRVWSGQFAPHRALGLNLADDFDKEHHWLRFFYRTWPLHTFGQIDRLLARRPEVLPWYDRYAGESYRRRIADRYIRQLNTLADRVTLQQSRVRDAEEYARLLKPQESK
jgi:hypothetical protein